MNSDHIKDKLDGFVFGEFDRDERQQIAEHLLVCEDCRREHDELKLAASLFSKLPAVDAPPQVWANIQDKLDGRDRLSMGLIPQSAWFSWQKGVAVAFSLAIVSVLGYAVYVGLLRDNGPQLVRGPQNGDGNLQAVNAPPSNNAAVDSTTVLPDPNSNINVNANSTNSNTVPGNVTAPSWQVETLAGMPRIGEANSSGSLAVGQMLETDERSRAKIEVANIGSVEVAPNSRVKLVGTGKDEHRLALDRGRLHAKIFAPPRLFVVDTPSGKAVDLGCEYTLEVDRVGNSVLNVTGGFVAMEDRGRESIVPAGMKVLTRKGKGLGTPFSPDTSPEFRRALEQFDFGNGGKSALQTILARADFYDMVTLWHLLSRVSNADRSAVFEKLAGYVAPPSGVTREGVIALDKGMLQRWRAEVETVWFN